MWCGGSSPSSDTPSCRADVVIGMLPHRLPDSSHVRLRGKTNLGKGGFAVLYM